MADLVPFLTLETQERTRRPGLATAEDAPLLFVAANFLAGIVSLVASRLVGGFCRPAVVAEAGEEVGCEIHDDQYLPH